MQQPFYSMNQQLIRPASIVACGTHEAVVTELRHKATLNAADIKQFATFYGIADDEVSCLAAMPNFVVIAYNQAHNRLVLHPKKVKVL